MPKAESQASWPRREASDFASRTRTEDATEETDAAEARSCATREKPAPIRSDARAQASRTLRAVRRYFVRPPQT
jgi:hypothetical protein